MVTLKNGVVEASGDIFIIPNELTNAVCRSKSITETMNKILVESGFKERDDVNLILIQVCITSENDLETDNLTDHGGRFLRSENSVSLINYFPSSLPVNILLNHKEGDIVDVVYPKGSLHDNPDFDLVLHLRCAQSVYRYRNHGTFEEVLNKLLIDFSIPIISGNSNIKLSEV